MILIHNSKEWVNMLRNCAFYPCRPEMREDSEKLEGFCCLSEEVLGGYFHDGIVDAVLFSKEYARERHQKEEEYKDKVRKEITTVKEYLARNG